MNLFDNNDDNDEDDELESYFPTKIDASENLDEAMYNGYLVMTGRITFEELLIKDEVWLSFDVGNYNEDEVLKDLIKYFEETEEYEICQELVTLANTNTKKS
jgi:folate-binding Fe-S cluster repair protein YgfZ